ncbi:MAG: asparagine synthase (glutamine-hydrolyzing), partial [Carboxydocellales bacterium]
MCGICGFIGVENTAVLEAMCQSIKHRGPDDQGTFIKDGVSLGHRRLSIIDIGGGHQPMFNEDGRVAIVFNGVIYNFEEIKNVLMAKGHHFKTNSDTEVIIHGYEEWQENLLSKLNGMFSFVIYDSRKRELFLARDRVGKKPLYYSLINGGLVFGSELKAVLKHPAIKADLDFGALAKYLAYEYVPSPYCIYQNIYKLKPGNFIKLNILKLEGVDPLGCQQQYWDCTYEDFNLKFKDKREEEAYYVQNTYELLKKAVQRRLISDVPLGVFLSGGIDSSSIVALMSEIMPAKDIKTFSIGFQEGSYDESSYARLIAQYFGTDHKEDILTPEKLLEIIPEVIENMDEPFADPSIIPTYLLSRFTRQHVKVALGGDGGDEFFAGYQPHIADKFLGNLRLPKNANKLLQGLAGLLPVSNENISLDFKIKQTLSGLSYPRPIRSQVWMGAFHPDIQQELLRQRVPEDVYELNELYWEQNNGRNLNERFLYLFKKLYLEGDILIKVDRASMANSLEVRAPLLDVELIEFVNKIPFEYKLKGLT